MDERKYGVLHSIKDLMIFLILLGGVIYGGMSIGNNPLGLILVGIGLWIIVKMTTILAALGATLLFESSYIKNKEEYKVNLSPFTQDKTQALFHIIKVSLLCCVGVVALPFVLLYGLFHIKDFFVSNKALEEKGEMQRDWIESEHENDIRFKTVNKKWLVRATPDCYFHTKEEAEQFIIENNLYPLKPEKLLF